MSVIRDIRTNYKDFLARLFIDFILLWMRFMARIYRIKNGSDVTVENKEEQDISRQRDEDSRRRVNEQTDGVNERNSRQHGTTEQEDEMGSSFGRTDEEMDWLRNGRHLSDYSGSLEEVDSSVLESTGDLRRQISALSDYYSDDEDVVNRWTNARRDQTIAENLSIAQDLERGSSSDFRPIESTYASFCEGLEKLKHDFKEILEKWKKRNEESMRDLRRSTGSVEMSRTRGSPWNRSAVDWRGSDSSVLNGSLGGSTTSRLSQSLCSDRQINPELHRQMLLTHEQLTQRRSALNHRMLREYNETKELLVSMEKKRIELCAKVNDQEWKGLTDSCDVLYAEQPQLRDHCKRLTRKMVDRRKDVQDGIKIVRAAVEGLSSCLGEESRKLKAWSERKTSTINQIEQAANKLKRQFDERRTVVTEMECNSYIKQLTNFLHLHAAASAQFFEEWKAMSHHAKDILKRNYLDMDEHEERCIEWREFSEVDESKEEYERNRNAFQEYVPRICEIHERRSPGSTGLFGRKPESVEFNRFYQNYKRKMKAIRDDYIELESSQMHCCQDIENYSELYDVFLGITEKQRQIDEILKEEESMIGITREKIKEFKDSIHLHLISKQGNRVTDQKRQIVEALKRLEGQLSDCYQNLEMFSNGLIATRTIVDGIEKSHVLRRHFERLKSFAADWEKHKNFEKLFVLISQIENFRAAEDPQRLEFEVHEERVNFLEKRLPKIVELHHGNYSTYLQKWLDYSFEYNEDEQESLSFDKIANLYETWSSDCQRISGALNNIKKESTESIRQLLGVEEALSLLNAQGYDAHDSESPNFLTDWFDVHFHRVEAACRNFRQSLTDFQPVYGRYIELKTGHHQVMESLAMEQYSADKLTDKLENCKGLLRGHRDHLERRRIRIKVEELLASMKELLFIKAKESEKQIGSLNVEIETLIRDFVDLSGQHFSEITHLRIPNLKEFLTSLDNFEQNLNHSEEKLGKCEDTLIREEKTVHEYFNSVRNQTELLKDACDRTKVSRATLEAGEKLLLVCQGFIEGYTKQERNFDTNLRESKRKLTAFKDAFDSAENAANELDQLFRQYCSNFACETSGDSFRERCKVEMTEIFATIVDYSKCLNEAEHSIRIKESEARKRLEEGKRDREGIRHELVVLSKEIIDQRELLRRCKSLLIVMLEKKLDRDGKADAFKKRLQGENYEEHCKMYQSNPMENEDFFTCPLCSKNIRPREGIVLRECLHKFCKKCLEMHVTDSKTAVVRCPGSSDKTSCFGVVLDKEILTFGEDLNKLCADRSLSEYKDQNRFVLTCGSCNKPIVDDGQPRCQKTFFKCPYCDKKNCRRCKVVHEDRETCEDYQLTLPYRKIVESLKCKICMVNDIQVAFIPCGHVVCCADCTKRLREMTDGPNGVCPICKKDFLRTMKIYLPINDEKADEARKVSQRK